MLPTLILGLLLTRSASATAFHGIPRYQYDKDTTKYCAWWIDNTGDWTCDRIRDELEVSLRDFHDWVRLVFTVFETHSDPSYQQNPCLPIGCKALPREQSFCVGAGRPRPVSTTTQTVTVPTTRLSTATIVTTATVNRTLTTTATVTFNRTVTVSGTSGGGGTATSSLNRTLTTTSTLLPGTGSSSRTSILPTTTAGTATLNRTLTTGSTSLTGSGSRTSILPTTTAGTASLNRTISNTAPVGTASLNRTVSNTAPTGTAPPPPPTSSPSTPPQSAGAASIGSTVLFALVAGLAMAVIL